MNTSDGLVPQKLPGWMAATGYQHIQSRPLPFFDTELRGDGLAAMMHRLLAIYARQATDEADMADAWEAEQSARADAGTFYFAFTHVVTIGCKP